MLMESVDINECFYRICTPPTVVDTYKVLQIYRLLNLTIPIKLRRFLPLERENRDDEVHDFPMTTKLIQFESSYISLPQI